MVTLQVLVLSFPVRIRVVQPCILKRPVSIFCSPVFFFYILIGSLSTTNARSAGKRSYPGSPKKYRAHPMNMRDCLAWARKRYHILARPDDRPAITLKP